MPMTYAPDTFRVGTYTDLFEDQDVWFQTKFFQWIHNTFLRRMGETGPRATVNVRGDEVFEGSWEAVRDYLAGPALAGARATSEGKALRWVLELQCAPGKAPRRGDYQNGWGYPARPLRFCAVAQFPFDDAPRGIQEMEMWLAWVGNHPALFGLDPQVDCQIGRNHFEPVSPVAGPEALRDGLKEGSYEVGYERHGDGRYHLYELTLECFDRPGA